MIPIHLTVIALGGAVDRRGAANRDPETFTLRPVKHGAIPAERIVGMDRLAVAEVNAGRAARADFPPQSEFGAALTRA